MRSPAETTSPFVRGWKAAARHQFLAAIERAGYRLERLEDTATFVDDSSTKTPELLHRFGSIPGMITHRRGMFYYLLAYASALPGDVIEVGCWQGRATAFLAQACEDTNNGVVHVVDHFHGNPGNETAYAVGDAGTSDLEATFRANMRDAGLADRVRLFSGDSIEQAPRVAEHANNARLIVIDAEHTYDAVAAELAAYTPLLAPGGILAFDDYSVGFPGVARAIGEYFEANADAFTRPFQDRNFVMFRRRVS